MNDEKLIDLVKSQPAIYDKTNIFYSNKQYVKSVWKQVASEMQKTVPVCQKRWRYLRDYFVRQLHMTHNQTDIKPSLPAILPQRKRSFWPLFDKMSFLKPFSSTRKNKSSECKKTEADQTSVLSVSSSNSLGEFNSFDYMTMYQAQYASEIEQAESEYFAQGEFTSPKMLQEPVLSENPTYQKKRKQSEIVEELLSVLKRSEQTKCDEHEHFFKSLLNSVRKIDDDQIMSFRAEVLQLVMKYKYMSRRDRILEDGTSDVVVIDTSELNWRKNLNCF